MTGIVIVVGCLLYLAIRAVTREPQQRRYPVGEMLEARFGLDAPRRNQLARLTEIALTLRPHHRCPAVPDAAVGLLRRRHPRLVQVAVLRHRGRPVPHLARPHPARHRPVHRAAVRHPAVPALAAREGAAADAPGPRHRQFHRHRGRATSASRSPPCSPSPTPASTSPTSPSSPARCRSASASACSRSSTTSSRA